MGNTNVTKVLGSLQAALLSFDQFKVMQGVADIQRKVGEFGGSEKPVYDAKNNGGGVLFPAGYAGQGVGYWRIEGGNLSNTGDGETQKIDADASRFVVAALLGTSSEGYFSSKVQKAIESGVLSYTACLVKSEQKACEAVLASGKLAVKEAVEEIQRAEQAKAEAAEAKRRVEESPEARIMKAETFVESALKLIKDMRDAAVKQDSVLNRTTPKHVDEVASRYMPFITVASGSTPVEKSESRYQLAVKMLEDLFKTPTGKNLIFSLASNPLYSCTTNTEEKNCHGDETGSKTVKRNTCEVKDGARVIYEETNVTTQGGCRRIKDSVRDEPKEPKGPNKHY